MDNQHVVNVCFHGIGVPRRELEPGEEPYWVSQDQFLGILDEVMTWPSVRISFDDGNASDVDIALPALLERGLQADFFLLAGRLDTAGSVSRDGVRELHHHGMTIGSHGMWHRPWRGLDPAAEQEELVVARDQLAELVDTAVATAACPLGRYDRRLLASLRRLGYRTVYTSDRRRARRGSWLQPRFSARRPDTAASLRRDVLAPPPLPRRVRLQAIAVAKRFR